MVMEISKSVGKGKSNKNSDVLIIQELLNEHIASGILTFQNIPLLDPEGSFGNKTRSAIKEFQMRLFMRPDGVVSPSGRTLKELNKAPVLPDIDAVSKVVADGIENGPPSDSNMNPISVDMWNSAMETLSFLRNNSLLAKPEILTLIDFRKSRKERRMWVVNMADNSIRFNTLVSHGEGSGKTDIPKSFSNNRGSHESSLGGYATLFIRQSKAGSKGKTKSRPALVVEGLEESINDAARERAILFHGAHYVTDERAGSSFGCFATEQDINDELIEFIKSGSFVYAHV